MQTDLTPHWQRHSPALWKAVALACAGEFALLTSARPDLVPERSLPAFIVGAAAGYGLCAVECLLLVLDKVVENNLAISKSAGALAQLPAEQQVALVGGGVPELPGTTRVQYSETVDGSFHAWLANLPLDAQRLRSLAQGVILEGAPLSGPQWSGPGKLMSDPEWRKFSTALRKYSLATWKDSRARSQGLDLTPPGRGVFRRLAQ